MFRKLLDEAITGDNIGALLRVYRGRDRAWAGTFSAGLDPSAHALQQQRIRAEEGRGRKTHAVLSTDTDRSSRTTDTVRSSISDSTENEGIDSMIASIDTYMQTKPEDTLQQIADQSKEKIENQVGINKNRPAG